LFLNQRRSGKAVPRARARQREPLLVEIAPNISELLKANLSRVVLVTVSVMAVLATVAGAISYR